MSANRIFGIALVAVGIILLAVGLSSANGFVDQVSKTFTGRYTHGTMLYLIGGAVAILCGGALALAGRRD